MMAAHVKAKGTELEIGAVDALFGPLDRPSGISFEVSSDGQRFLSAVSAEEGPDPQLTVVRNWAAGLK